MLYTSNTDVPSVINNESPWGSSPAATETGVLNMRGAVDSGSGSEARQCEFAMTVQHAERLIRVCEGACKSSQYRSSAGRASHDQVLQEPNDATTRRGITSTQRAFPTLHRPRLQ